MRALLLLSAGLALSLAACGNNDQTDNNQNVDENLSAANIVSNDVTAIDAVTGDASNMAADSDVNDLGDISNDTGNVSAFPKPKPETDRPASSRAAANSVANSAANSAAPATVNAE